MITKLSDKRDRFKDDFQSVLRSLSTPMFVSLVEMRIDVIRFEQHALSLRHFKFFS